MKLNYKKLSDNELVNLLKTDKHKDGSFAEIYERYSRRIYAYCRKMLNNSEEANDIFQEVFAKFYHASQNKILYGNILHLLLKIARNLCLNSIRDKHYDSEFDEDVMSRLDNEQESYELRQILNIAVDKLKSDYKEVFILRMYEGLEYDEIAEITGDNNSGVRSKCWRAKEKVKILVTKYLNELEINNNNI